MQLVRKLSGQESMIYLYGFEKSGKQKCGSLPSIGNKMIYSKKGHFRHGASMTGGSTAMLLSRAGNLSELLQQSPA